MTVTDVSGKTGPGKLPRGLSMDVMPSPYLLPAEVGESRGSIHSMARSMADENDPYRPVTFVKSDSDSLRSGRPSMEKGSIYSAATSQHSSNENATLLRNARPMSQSFPKRGESMSPHDSQSSDELLPRQMHSANRSMPPSRKTSLGSSDQPPLTNIIESSPRRDEFVPPPPPPPPTKEPQQAPPPRTSSSGARQPRKSSLAAETRPVPRESSDYGDSVRITPASPPRRPQYPQQRNLDSAVASNFRASHDEPRGRLYAPKPIPGQRLSVMGSRPLPPNVPEDNPEMRANRIRSFYKEYFDDSRPNPAYGQYEEDYDPGYLQDGAIYDPQSGGFVTAPPKPFAAPMGRRAMTPPPRGAPRGSGGPPPHRRNMSTQSASRMGPRGRAQSMPKKQLPPPMPLQSLPTPHMLKEDSHIFNPLDFAPPVSFRDQQMGRAPDSPTGISRPYSPSVTVHSPLVSAYDELSPMPSPYLLRKSGTFTALDFAPPSVFKERSNASDAGSIRSARSGISAMQQDAVRKGAYRVSRIPTDTVFTKDDMTNQLKPSWDMRRGDKIMG